MIDSAQSDFYGVYICIKALLVPKVSISFYFKRFKLQSVAFLTYTIITTALLHFLDLSHAYFTNQGSTFSGSLLIWSVCLFEVLLLQPYFLSPCQDIQTAFFSYVTEISGLYGCFSPRICFKMATDYSGHDCGISLFIMIREEGQQNYEFAELCALSFAIRSKVLHLYHLIVFNHTVDGLETLSANL